MTTADTVELLAQLLYAHFNWPADARVWSALPGATREKWRGDAAALLDLDASNRPPPAVADDGRGCVNRGFGTRCAGG